MQLAPIWALFGAIFTLPLAAQVPLTPPSPASGTSAFNDPLAANPAELEAPTDRTADAVKYDVVEYKGPANKVDAWQVPVTVQLRGEIKQFDTERLAMIESDGSPRTVPGQQIVRIEPNWRNTAAADAHQLFVERKYKAVTTTVPVALQSNLVQWQQRLLIAELVQSVAALGDARAAGIYFLSLAKSNPPHLLYADMPLCWTVCEPQQTLRAEAQKWLSSDQEAARLMGASWLLFDDQSTQAQQALAQLKVSPNTAIAQLATVQGWRLSPPPQTMSQLTGWFEFRDQLIPPLQLGPTEFIADRLMRIGQHELAIGQWLSIASHHGDRPHRATQALQSAAAQLKRMGRDQEAQRLEAWINKLAPSN